MKSYNRNDHSVRWAIFQAYGQRDFYNEREPIFYDTLEIDHLIPQELASEPEKLKDIITEIGLPTNFNINSIINLVPTKKKYNSTKGKIIFSSNNLRFYFEQTSKKHDQIEKLIKVYSKKRDLEKTIRQLLPHSHGCPDLLKIIDDSLISNRFSGKEYVSERNVTNSTDTVYIDGFLPSDESLSGSCLILFNELKIRDSLISFSEPYISDVLFSGVGKEYNSKERKYVLFPNDEGNYYIQLGNIRLLIPPQELKDLCSLIDFYYEHYMKKITQLKSAYGINKFKMSSNHSGVYKLFKTTRLLWGDMLDFANKYDYDRGNTGWNIFDRGDNTIKIVSRPDDKRFSSIFHSYILPEPKEYDFLPNVRNPDNEVWICWKPMRIGYNEKFGFKDTWTAEETYNFLIKELIPKVIYDIENGKKIFKPKFKKFLSGFQIDNYIST